MKSMQRNLFIVIELVVSGTQCTREKPAWTEPEEDVDQRSAETEEVNPKSKQECILLDRLLESGSRVGGGLPGPGGALPGPGGVFLILWGSAWSRGVWLVPEGVWHPSMHWGRHPPPLWTDTHLWKHYLGHNGVMFKEVCPKGLFTHVSSPCRYAFNTVSQSMVNILTVSEFYPSKITHRGHNVKLWRTWYSDITGWFILEAKAKTTSLPDGFIENSFNEHIEPRQISTVKFAFLQCKWTLKKNAFQ